MGLLSPDDWNAEWLAVEDGVARADRQIGLHPIWGTPSPEETARKFRLRITMPTRAVRGVLSVGGKDLLAGIWIDGEGIAIQAPPRYSYDVQPLQELTLGPLGPGDHVFAVEVRMHSGEMRSPAGAMTAFVRLQLENGATVRIPSGPEWRTSLTQEAGWFACDYDDRAWERARAMPDSAPEPWPCAPAMHLRKAFTVEEPVSRARLYGTALGSYEASINGQRVGDALLTPESTRYSNRALYRVYDVTQWLRRGVNALGFTVGDGWYASSVFGAGRYAWGPPPRRMLAQLELSFADGSRQLIATGSDWRIGSSPILRSDIYNGEMVDARLREDQWDAPGFDDSHWVQATLAERPSCRLVAQVSPPIRATEVLKARAITHPTSDAYVIDFGQNFAGWCRLRAKGPRGTRIELRFAEVLQPSGEVDQSNLRAARQTDVFILRGDSTEEIFEPKFTYHGFRYVQISGLPAPPTEDSVEGVVIHSDLPVTGSFRVDVPLVQQIWQNTLWTQRSNFMGIPTDCPQRDERLGNLGDAAVFWDAAAFNMDVAAFTRQHMASARDSQSPEGTYPDVAPTPSPYDPPIPGWADGAIILPWTVWQRYGDAAIIEQNWEGMNRYLQYILKANPDYLWRNERTDIGDWLAVDRSTPLDLIATAYWAHSVILLAQMAQAIDRVHDATALENLHARIRAAFIAHFVRDGGGVGNESQTSCVLALQYGLLPEQVKPKVAARLAADIRRRGTALSTGFLGTQYLLDVLVESGHRSLAYDLLLRTAYPSWGYMIAQGATTVWESWDGRVWSGPKNETMPNSYNHFYLGAVSGFLFRKVAGIDAALPGFESVVIRPILDTRIKRCSADYDSVMGRISTNWEQAQNRFALAVTLPANTVAQIHLPARSDSRIDESGTDIEHHPEIRSVHRRGNEATLEVGSGSYRFVVM
jgi:alpha-L-rhamnosidase